MVYRLEDEAGGPRVRRFRFPSDEEGTYPLEDEAGARSEEIDEEEEVEEEEELEPQGSSKSIWTRGIAGLPKEPANDDAKTLIKPNNKDNWSFVGTPGCLPDGVLGVLLKKYWPGLYRVTPLDETCLEKKLALKWEDYEAAHDESFGTRANAVITSFWAFYKVPTEDSTKAGQVLVNAARKMVRQQRYDARIVAISHFYAEQGKRVLKKEIVEKGLTLSKEEFMGVAPKWTDGRDDGWAALVDLWVEKDAEFKAQSMKNRENRGKGGTHNAGNRSHDHYKAHQEHVHGKPLTKLGAWKMSHKKTKVDKHGEEQYYGKSGTYLQNYETAFKKLHGEDSQPLEEEVDETAVIVSGLGKPHGRHRILDGVIAPTTTLAQVRASSTSSSQLIPPRPRPGGSRQAFDASLDEAYDRLYESYEEKLEEYVKSVEAHDAYQASHNAAVMTYITTGVQPTMGSPPPPKTPLPRIPTREEFLASVASGIPGSAQSSTDFGRASASPSPSPRQSPPITPIHTGSGRGPSASAEPADLPFQ
ncbi:hypothetical protein ACQ4PT_062987 [Festuca glaucescens]